MAVAEARFLLGQAAGLPVPGARCLAADDAQAFVGSAGDGLFVVDRETATIAAVPGGGDVAASRTQELILTEDSLWVVSSGGAARLDRESGAWEHPAPLQAQPFSAAVLEEERLWLAGAVDVVAFDLRSGEARGVTRPRHGDLSCMAAAPGQLWCGFDEETASLFVLHVDRLAWSRVRAGPYVLSLMQKEIEPGAADLWVGTCTHVERVDRETCAGYPYGVEGYGMVHALRTVGDHVVIGTGRGLLALDVGELRARHLAPPVHLGFADSHVVAVDGGARFAWSLVERHGLACFELAAS